MAAIRNTVDATKLAARDELHHRFGEGARVELRGVEAEQPEPDCGKPDEIGPNRSAGQVGAVSIMGISVWG